MSKSDEFIPLSKLKEGSDNSLSWGVSLPDYVPAKSIGLSVSRLDNLSSWAGLHHLTIDSEKGEQTNHQVEVNELLGGNASGLNFTREEVPLSTVQVDPEITEKPTLFSEYRWGQGYITINTAELGSRVASEASDGEFTIREPEPWSNLLDEAIRTGIYEAAREQLLGDVSGLSKLYLGFAVINTLLSGGSNSYEGLIYNAFWSSVIVQSTSCLFANLQGMPLRERRLSLLPAYQLDRLMVVKALSSKLQLVKTLQ